MALFFIPHGHVQSVPAFFFKPQILKSNALFKIYIFQPEGPHSLVEKRAES